jgi:hypothetical protein
MLGYTHNSREMRVGTALKGFQEHVSYPDEVSYVRPKKDTVTNSMEQISSWEADSQWGSQGRPLKEKRSFN